METEMDHFTPSAHITVPKNCIPAFAHLSSLSFSEPMLKTLLLVGVSSVNKVGQFLKIVVTPLLHTRAQRTGAACMNHRHHSATPTSFINTFGALHVKP